MWTQGKNDFTWHYWNLSEIRYNNTTNIPIWLQTLIFLENLLDYVETTSAMLMAQKGMLILTECYQTVQLIIALSILSFVLL